MTDRVLITGANCDIASAVIDKLLQQSAKLILQTRDVKHFDSMLKLNSGSIKVIESDIGSKENVETIFNDALSAFGGIDAIVHCAAFSSSLGKVTDVNWWQLWEKSMHVNVVAPTSLTMMASEYFKEHNIKGKVVMITSRAVHQGDSPEKMHYAATKAALANVTKTIAKNFKEFNIHAYNVAPSFVMTKRIKETVLTDKSPEWIKENFPLEELVPPEQVAEVIEMLLTKNLSHLTGSTIDINGGTYLR